MMDCSSARERAKPLISIVYGATRYAVERAIAALLLPEYFSPTVE